MKVSFIIPVYNVERYLEQCVDSILNQTYKNIEVVLVDDGSTDGSPKICDDYVLKDNRVRVLHKKNGGQSDARNRGVLMSTGDYIVFVDSDDYWIGQGSLQRLIDVVCENEDCDFIGFNCSYFYPESNSYKNWVPYNEVITQKIDRDSAVEFLVSSGTFPMSPCLKIISRKFLDNIDLCFRVGTLAEDIPWFIDLLEGAQKCLFLNDYVYAYRQNVSGSVTKSNSERVYSNLFEILKLELVKLESRSFNRESKDALYSFLAYEFCILLSILSDLPNSKVYRQELRQYKWLLNYTLNPKVKKASYVYKFLGLRMTELVLRLYNKKRISQS